MNEAEWQETSAPISLAERRVFSPLFKPLYDEGMRLVEQAAEYLDGQGRLDVKDLTQQTSSLYAAESMRLTTRLMQVASWLLLQRAANAGEMTREQVHSEKSKVRLDTTSALDDAPNFAELPEDFRTLVRHSLALQKRVRNMDDEIYGALMEKSARGGNPVSEQILLLKTAFGR